MGEIETLYHHQSWDVTIIGGGLAGLTAAVLLGQAGKKALLLEGAGRLGGRAMTNEITGSLFNLGPHALFRKGAGLAILRSLGISVQGGSPDVKGKLVSHGQVFDMPSSPFALLTSSYLAWPEKKELIRFMIRLPQLADRLEDQLSLREWLIENIASDKVNDYLLCMARLVTYHHAPDQVRAKAVFTQLRTALGGILYLHGGWQQLVDQLAKKAKQHHVTLLTGVKVRAIEGAYPNLLVHGKGHHIFKTRQVISTLPPVSLLKLLPKTINRRLELLRQFQPIKGASLDLALYHLPQKHTSFALGTDQPLYFSNHSRAAHLSDQGHTVIHLFKYLNGRETRNAQAIKKELEEFMDLLQPGWREKVVTSRFMPNLTVSHYLPVSDYKQWVQTLPHISEVMPGVHVCGDWTTAEHMLADAAIYSAYSAARRIIQSGETERGMAY